MLEKITTLRNQGKTEAEILKEHVDVKAFLVKLSAGLAIGMFGGDMQAAHDAADCAIENNSLFFVQAVMAALAAGYVYVTGEELINAHKRGGFDEVLRVIKSEAEVVFITEATAAEFGGMPGAALAAGGYMVYRIGGKLYPTAQKAWGALVKAQTALDNLNIQKGFADWCKGKGVKDVDLSGLKLLEPPKMVEHHIFNKFRGKSSASQKYRDFFKKHSINVDDFCILVSDSMHRQKIHVAQNNWTTQWKKWIDANPNASTKQVYQFAGEMMDRYGVSHHELKKYLK